MDKNLLMYKRTPPKDSGEVPDKRNIMAEEDDLNWNSKKKLPCDDVYLPKRYLTTSFTALGMLLAYAMRTNLGVTVITILDSYVHTKVHHSARDHLPTVDWDTREVGFLHSAFYIGFMITHVPGGYLTTIWPSHRIFGGSILLSAALNLLLPLFIEEVGYIGTCSVRILQGMAEGLLYPACYGLLRHWSTTKERGRLVSAVLTGGYAGAIVGFPLAGFLTHFIGWQYVYYVCGGACIVWYLFWLCLVYEKPSHHASISDEEFKYLCDAQGEDVIDYENLETPWVRILTSLPVISLCVCHFARNWIFVFMLTNEAYYLNSFGSFSVAESGSYASIPHIVKVIVAFASGYLADKMLGSCSTTMVRKLLTSIGFGSVGVCFLVLTFVRSGTTAIVVLSVCAAFFALSISGWQINHYDLSTRYAGVLVSITSAFGTLGAIIVPMVTGECTKDRTLESWDEIFFLTTGLFLFSGTFFAIFGSGDEQPWSRLPSNIDLVQKIDPLARKPYKPYIQQTSYGSNGITADTIDGTVREKEDNITKLVDRLSKQLSVDDVKKDS